MSVLIDQHRMIDGTAECSYPLLRLQYSKLREFITSLFMNFMQDSLPRRLVKFDMAAWLQQYMNFFVHMKQNSWLGSIGPDDERACGLIMLAWLGMDMWHRFSIRPFPHLLK